MFKFILLWGLPALGMLLGATSANAQECTGYCVCNGASEEICSKDLTDCPSPKTALCANASCRQKTFCCCSERFFEPSEDGGGTIVFRLSDCSKPVTCEEICGGGGGFPVHGGEDIPALLEKVMDLEIRARRARALRLGSGQGYNVGRKRAFL
jgi:hypothetical protein